MNIRWNKSESKTGSYKNFDDNDEEYDASEPEFVDEEELLLIDENQVRKVSDTAGRKKNIATWRKIEEFWENYELNKQINDDIYN